MHFGVVRVWMRYGKVTDGTLGKGKYLLILRNYADGGLRMGSRKNIGTANIGIPKCNSYDGKLACDIK